MRRDYISSEYDDYALDFGDSDCKFGIVDIGFVLLEFSLIFLLLIGFVLYVLKPALYQIQDSNKVQNSVEDPVVLSELPCCIGGKDYMLPLHGEDLLMLGLVTDVDVSLWDEHETYIFDSVYQDYYRISGVVAYSNGKWYTKDLEIKLLSVQAEHNVVSVLGNVYLNNKFGDLSRKHPEFFSEESSGVYKVTCVKAKQAFERYDTLKIYSDKYTDVITELSYQYDTGL